MNIIIGLGNPGKKYDKTRHNMGFLVIDHLAERWSKFKSPESIDFKEKKRLNALVEETTYQNEKIIVAKPTTFMNNSGLAVEKIKSYFKANTDELIVVHDDKDLSFGKIRIKKQGSDGGHNGIKSIIQELGTKNFTRVKIGIEQTNRKKETTDFVLDKFSKKEEKELPTILDWAAEAIEAVITNGADQAANRFN